MSQIIQLELTAQEVEQLLRVAQKGYDQVDGFPTQEAHAAYIRAIGKLHMARAEGMSAPTKRPYTRRATKTARKTAKAARKYTRSAKTPVTPEE